MKKDRNQNKTFFSALEIAFCVFLSRITGLLRDIVFASFLGTGIIAEAFYVAFRLPNTFRRIFAEGAFTNAFAPFFSSKVKENRLIANNFSAKILVILLSFLIILTLLVEVFMPSIIKIISPGFLTDNNKFTLAVTLSRIAFPYVILISVTAFFGSLLNSIGSFWQFSFVSVLLNLIFIFGLFFTKNLYLNIGVYLSYLLIFAGVAQVIFVSFFCVKKALFPSFKSVFFLRKNNDYSNNDNYCNFNVEFERIEENKKDVILFIKKLIPAVISSGILQINIFVDGIFASFFPGAISYLYYSDRIGQFPLSIIGYSLSVAILPFLSIAFKEKNYDEVAVLQQRSFNIAVFFSVPATLIIYALSEQIVSLFYQHGSFTHIDTRIVAIMLSIYAISIPFNILSKIIFSCFYAQKDTKTPMKISIFSLILNVVMNLILIRIIGMYCVIVSTTMSAILSCIVAILLLKKDKKFYINSSNFKFLIKVVFVSIISCVFVPLLFFKLNLFLILIIIGCSYLALCVATNIIPISFIGNFFSKIKKVSKMY